MDLRPNPSPDEIAKRDEATGVSSTDWASHLSDRSAGSARALLAEFARTGDERTFEEVVRRYAGMVHAVCVRITKDAHDAEDATQAVFLALAMHVKTRPDQPIKYLGPWLQQVARRLSLDTRRSKGRRKKREAKLGEMERQRLGIGFLSDDRNTRSGITLTDSLAGPIEQLDQDELRHLISSELEKLPAKYRLPLILHYFGGMSREEMSKELGIKPNTLGVRVFRGRELLGKRLADKGIVLGASVLAVLLEESVRTSVSNAWISATAQAASSMMTAGPSAVAATQVVGVLRAISRGMMLARLKLIGISVLLLASVSAGGAEVARQVAKQLNLQPTWNVDIGGQIRQFLKSLVQPTLSVDASTAVEDVTVAGGSRMSMDPGLADRPSTPLQQVQSIESFLVTTNHHAGRPQPAGPELPPLPMPIQLDRNDPPPAQASPVVAPLSHPRRNADQGASRVLSPLASNLVVGSGVGSSQSKVLEQGQTLQSQEVTIGEYGAGSFTQRAGSVHRIDSSLMLGRFEGSRGRYELAGRNARLEVAGNEVIGGRGYGEFIQSDGANIVGGSLVVGQSGTGRFEQSGGVTTAREGAIIAELPGSEGTVVLKDGEFRADPQLIGKSGVGTLLQSGGTNSAKTVWVAPDRGSRGTYSLPRGVLELDALTQVTDTDVFVSADDNAGINVGGAGAGSFRLGAINKKARIIEKQAGSYLAVRAKQHGSGTFHGWGSVGITGKIVNNGQIIADGYGAPHALDLSAASEVVNTIQNPPIGGDNGWFARNGGELILPPLEIEPGPGIYSWGESTDDALPDLVNSVRIHVGFARGEGEMQISLLSTDRVGIDVPAFPAGHQLIGTWSFESDIDTSGVDLAVRYDDALALAQGLDENILKLWRFDAIDNEWQGVNDHSFRRYPALNIVTGHVGTDFTYFAVSAPEPTMLAPLALGGWLLLRRKRRFIPA